MSDTEFEFDGVLDLSGADESAGTFEAAPSGSYACHVENVVWKQVENEGGKLPVGTPFLSVWWKCDEEELRSGQKVENKVFFQTLFPVMPADYDASKAARNKGSVVNMLKAVGYTDADIGKKGFRIDPDDMMGRTATVVVKRYKNDYKGGDWDNSVQGVKPLGQSSAKPAGAAL